MSQDVISKIESSNPQILFEEIKSVIINFTPRFLGALIFIAVSHVAISGLGRVLKNFLKKSRIDPTLHNFIRAILKYSLWVVVIIIALIILGVPTTPLATIMGSVGLAMSLALKDSLTNVAGGISILFNRPFDKGDDIEVKEISGTVRSIDLFYTRIITKENNIVYLPNGDVSKSIVTNRSHPPQ